MGSVLEQLERREAVALARVEELRAEALAVADRLDAARIELSRLVIARRTVVEVLAAPPVRGIDSVAPTALGGPAPGVRGALRDVTVYQRIAAVFASAAGPLRAREVGDALGLGAEAKFTEALRSKLKRLVADGVLIEVEAGLFARVGAGVAG
ncbi:hypothetical protein [Streptacidiphilus albus]|uniref:hypothetical protein n=1 Tax=Streptacidiphilus albus TaxID=105425 RepID=UPI00054C508C|nr:hypothetical protein [Streptacidiphilus albus]